MIKLLTNIILLAINVGLTTILSFWILDSLKGAGILNLLNGDYLIMLGFIFALIIGLLVPFMVFKLGVISGGDFIILSAFTAIAAGTMLIMLLGTSNVFRGVESLFPSRN